jgi:Tol biopolymer transport system component
VSEAVNSENVRGRAVSHYQVLAKLGEGGMGVVWEARDSRLKRPVVLKFVKRQFTERFEREARAIAALNHPHICTLYDVGQHEGEPYLVMERVEGKPVKGPLPFPDVLKIAIQIADALAAAHAKGIVHRDLKPSNILVDAKHNVKVLDFGLAKLTEPIAITEAAPTETLAASTEEGVILGTVGYMSPEQAQGLKLDHRSDVFSLGAVLYEMITGRPAFRRENRLSTLSAILHDGPTPPSALVKDLPPEMERIVSRCLRKEPDRRFQTMADLKVALLELKEESDSGRMAAPALAARPVRPRPAWAFLALLAIGAGFFAYFFLSGRRAAAPLLKSVPLTTSPGLQFEPSLSPDGNEIVFAWDGEKGDNFDIYRKLIGPGAPLRLTTGPEPERSPAWSPDGKWIAFARLVDTRKFEVIVIPALGGPERKLAEVSGAFPNSLNPFGVLAWSPDGSWLAVAGASQPPGRGIALLALQSGEWRQLTTENDFAPAFSRDGHSLAFVRSLGLGISDIYTLRLSAQSTVQGQPKRLTEEYGWALSPVWTADGSEIVCSMGDFDIRGLWRVPVSAGTARQPLAGAGDGAESVTLLEKPGLRTRLVYNHSLAELNIWLAHPGGSEPPAPWSASTHTSDSPLYSPDGKRVAFASNRSGNFEAWVSDADASNPVQLTSFGQNVTAPISWSPDSRKLLVFSRVRAARQVYSMDSDGGRLDPVPGASGYAAFSADGKWIYFSELSEGKPRLAKAAARSPFSVASRFEINAPNLKVSPDGKFLYFTRAGTPPELWRVALDATGDVTGEPSRVLPAYSGGTSYDVTASGVFFIAACEAAGRGLCVRFLDLATSKPREIARIEKRIWPGLSVSPDGKAISWAQIDQQRSNLMLVENFR